MRVEMILPTLEIGGMEIATRNLARALVRRGHNVGITCLESAGGLTSETERGGVPVHLIECQGAAGNFLANHDLVAYLRREKVDVVHSHNGVWGKAVCAARRAGTPVIVNTLHGFAHDEPTYYHLLRKLAARGTDQMFGVSPALCEYLIRTLRVPNSRVTHVANGVDLERFTAVSRGEYRTRWGVSSDARVIGCVARLDRIKNHRLLLQAMQEVIRVCPNAVLVLIGDGPLRQELENQALHDLPKGCVVFAGASRDVESIYCELDIFVLPSNYEGTSISLLEAMASGIPAVATDVGGNSSVLEDGVCGMLAPTGDSGALASAIINILQSPRLAAKLREEGLRRAASFGTDAIAEKVELMYDTVLERRQSTSRRFGARRRSERRRCVGIR